MKLPGKLSVRKTIKILPGVRISGSLSSLRLLLGGMGITYSIPLLKRTPPKRDKELKKPNPPLKARTDRNEDRQINACDAFLVTGRKAAKELCSALDEKIVITNVVDDTHVEYWSGRTFHKVRTEVFAFWLDNGELARLEVVDETSHQSETTRPSDATEE